MNEENVLKILLKSFGDHISIKMIRPNTFQIFIPFYHNDGDMIEVFLHCINKTNWTVGDFGVTLMRLSYDTNVDTEANKRILKQIVSDYGIAVDERGRLSLKVKNVNDPFPDIMEMITVIIKVSDINLLKKEQVKSAFYAQFDKFVYSELKEFEFQKNYKLAFDAKWLYEIPYIKIVQKKAPIFLLPIVGDQKCQDYTMILMQCKINAYKNKPISIFEDQSNVWRKTLARFSDIADKQFSALIGNSKEIKNYISDYILW